MSKLTSNQIKPVTSLRAFNFGAAILQPVELTGRCEDCFSSECLHAGINRMQAIPVALKFKRGAFNRNCDCDNGITTERVWLENGFTTKRVACKACDTVCAHCLGAGTEAVRTQNEIGRWQFEIVDCPHCTRIEVVASPERIAQLLAEADTWCEDCFSSACHCDGLAAIEPIRRVKLFRMPKRRLQVRGRLNRSGQRASLTLNGAMHGLQ